MTDKQIELKNMEVDALVLYRMQLREILVQTEKKIEEITKEITCRDRLELAAK